MELWTCENCGSKNAGEACWKCQAARPASAAAGEAPSAPAPPSTAAEGSWDPSGAVPQTPAAPSWSEPITAWTGPASERLAPAPAEGPAPPPAAPPPPDPAAYAPPPPPPPAPYSPPAVSDTPAAASWSAPETSTPAATAVTAAPAPAPPPPPPPAAASSVPTARILLVAGIVVILLITVLLIVALNSSSSKALTTPPTIEGLPQIHGAAVDALARQARQNAGADAPGMLVGVYGNNGIPAFVFVVVKSRGNGLDTFERSFIRGASQAGVNPGVFQHRTQDGVQYDCGTVQTTAVGVPLSFCFFDDGSATGAGLAPAEPGIDRALKLTSSGRGAAESG